MNWDTSAELELTRIFEGATEKCLSKLVSFINYYYYYIIIFIIIIIIIIITFTIITIITIIMLHWFVKPVKSWN